MSAGEQLPTFQRIIVLLPARSSSPSGNSDFLPGNIVKHPKVLQSLILNVVRGL